MGSGSWFAVSFIHNNINMTFPRTLHTSRPAASFAVWLLVPVLSLPLLSSLAWGAPAAAKVEGPLACGECHKSEIEAWKTTHHFETFKQKRIGHPQV